MLFDFGSETEAMPRFWMKDMRFDLDIVWIKDNKIIGIAKNIPKPAAGTADEKLPTYSPPSPIDQVLEVNAGWTDKYKIKTGDEVRYENLPN
jgi:uncharacterized membrane protein (UPF0127 family)